MFMRSGYRQGTKNHGNIKPKKRSPPGAASRSRLLNLDFQESLKTPQPRGIPQKAKLWIKRDKGGRVISHASQRKKICYLLYSF